MILASLVLVAQTQFALPAENEKWVRVESPHFTVISSARESETRELVSNMEMLAIVLQQLHARFREQPLAHSRVLLFERRSEAQPYFDLLLSRGTRSPGAFVTSRGEGTMVLFARRNPDRTPYHELVHNLMGGATHPPLWLEEGLAEYYSNADFLRGTIRLGLPKRVAMARPMRGLRPMHELFAVPRNTNMTADNGFYRQASGAVAWLLRTNRAAFDAFEHDVEHGVPPETALRTHYNATIDQLQQGLAGMYYTDKLVVPQPKVNILITAAPMSGADVLYELGSFLAEFESTRDDAERHFRAALAADPKHEKARAALEPKSDPKPELMRNAQALVDQQKYDEAAVVVRKLAALTSDATARKDLEAQAAHLEQTAATNRHIAEYNEALEEAKAGDKAAALKRIDALLAVATDEEVIRDAKELRVELLRR